MFEPVFQKHSDQASVEKISAYHFFHFKNVTHWRVFLYEIYQNMLKLWVGDSPLFVYNIIHNIYFI